MVNKENVISPLTRDGEEKMDLSEAEEVAESETKRTLREQTHVSPPAEPKTNDSEEKSG